MLIWLGGVGLCEKQAFKVSSGGSKIWSRTDTVLWSTRRDRTMSVRCAKVREEFQNKKKRGRWSEFTGSLAGVLQQLRVGELKCGQPGGGEI
jgi:hypothetical protein